MDFLAGQVKALPSRAERSDGQDVAEAVALSLSMFHQISPTSHQTGGASPSAEPRRAFYQRWLLGAESIVMLLRSLKSSVPVDDRRQFMHAYLQAKAAIAPEAVCLPATRPLDEVMSELQP
jgi:hypothetical protein